MSQPIPAEPVEIATVNDPYRVTPSGAGSEHYIDPKTGYFGFLSPPGTQPVTSEDVKRLLESFP